MCGGVMEEELEEKEEEALGDVTELSRVGSRDG